jgi:hypothetical protein
LCTALLAGCVGNKTPYRPGFEEVPVSETVDDEHSRLMSRAIPMETARYDWFLHQGRQEVRRIRGNVARNPWRSYERDMASTLGEHAGEYLHADPNAILAQPMVDDDDEAEEEWAGDDAADDGDEWGDDEGGDEGGDDWGDDEGGDDDW